MGKSRSIDNKGRRQMKDKADDDMGEAWHVRARTQEQGWPTHRQHHMVLGVSTQMQTSTCARDTKAQDQSWRSKLDAYHLSLITYQSIPVKPMAGVRVWVGS